jgi:uncharacterized delta-60 repeat protein
LTPPQPNPLERKTIVRPSSIQQDSCSFESLESRTLFAAGALDRAFSSDGLVTTNLGFNNDIANSVAIRANGKIIVGGWAGNDFAIARYKANGKLDKTFGTNGIVRTNFANGEADSIDDIDGIVIQSDGKIVAAGGSHGDFAMARYNADGSLDKTFGDDGLVVTDFGSNSDRAQELALQENGAIVVVGSAGGNFAVARYLADGSPDNSFSGDGRLLTNFGFKNDIANSVAIQEDGKIVAGGWAGNDFSLARYNTNGTLDKTFSGDGKVSTNFANGASDSVDDIHSIALDSSGRIVAGGTAGGDFGLARYLTDGSLDTSFGNQGLVVTSFGDGLDRIRSIAIQDDGKIVAAGEAGGDFAVARYRSNGKLDKTFNSDGKVTSELSGGDDVIKSIAIQENGAIVAVGSSGTDFALARYLGA